MAQVRNIELLKTVALALDDLRNKVVFVGGTATGLYITDPAAPLVRPTIDVDVIVEAVSRTAYYGLGDELRARGFREDRSEGAPLCRWIVGDVKVDVMPTDTTILGFTNRWYKAALDGAGPVALDAGLSIRIATPPLFIATKVEAFNGRGRGDFMASSDMEDMVTIVDGRAELADEVAHAAPELREFIADTFSAWLKNPLFVESIAGHLPPDEASQGRKKIVMRRLMSLAL